MSFVPIFAVLFASPLAALAVTGGAAAVPVVIHLLNRKRYIVVNWAAMRFLIAAQKKNVRRLKLEQWLLLATRTLLVVMIAAAMAAVTPWAEPVWQRLFPGDALAATSQGRTHRIIVLDASFTMSARRADDVTRFDAAKAQAHAILDQANPGDGFSLILLTSPAQVIVPGPADDPNKVAREIDDLRLPHGSADVPGGLHLVAEMAAKPLGKYARREVYFVGDLRRSAWPLPTPAIAGDAPRPGSADAWQRILSSARVVAIDVAGRDEENVAVTALTTGDLLPLVDADMAVTATIQNHGRQPREKLPVELLIGKAGAKFALREVAQRLVDVPAGATVTVTFALDKQNRFREPGEYVLQVRAGDDALRADDIRSLALTVRDTISVMLVNGKPSAEPLDRGSEFLKRALNPFPEGQRSPDSPAAVRVLTPREFQDAGLGDLFRPDAPVEVVFLCDLPTIGGNEAARLEAHLKRGGSVVIGLGPNAAGNIDGYNRVLFNEGKGLLPGPLVGVRRAAAGQYYSLLADVDAFKQPPLAAFRSEQERSSFGTPQFVRYVRLDLPAASPARRLFSFLPSEKSLVGERPDPAVVEWPRHRGRVVVVTTSLNADWNEWPRTLSYPPFVQELLRFLVSGGARRTILAGEAIEEYVPSTFVGLSAMLTRTEDGEAVGEAIPVVSAEDAGLVRFPAIEKSGVYRLSVCGKHEALFAANVPVVSPTGGAESDLRRLMAADFKSAAPDADIQVVTEVGEIRSRPATAAALEGDAAIPAPRGPAIARVLLFAALALMLLEMALAWRYGSARAGAVADPTRVRPTRWALAAWTVPLLVCAVACGVVIHAGLTGEFLGFLPASLREPVERGLGVPAAAPGEGTRWRLDTLAYLTGEARADRWLMAGLVAVALLVVWRMYRRERPAESITGPRSWWRNPLVRLGALRAGLLLLTLTVLMPQVRLAFEREGWPDVVIVFDESRSMGVVDVFRDPAVKAAAEELKAEWTKIAAPRVRAMRDKIAAVNAQIARDPSSTDAVRLRDELLVLESRLQDLIAPHRLNLIKAMLARGDGEWLKTVLGRRQMRVHVYRVSDRATRMAELTDPDQCARLLEEIIDVPAFGESSPLGTAVEGILKTFRGGSLNAIAMFTDGVTTKGDDLPMAARAASRAGVPLFFVGVGDAAEPFDLALIDLRAEEVVNVNDRLVIEAKVRSQGPGMPDSVPVILSEIKDGKPVEIARQIVRLDAGGPTKIRFIHQPKEAGDKTFVVEVPLQPDEADATNNRAEHRVFVAEAKRVRVLLVEGYPRYDFRYVKSLFERESDAVRGNKAIDLDVYLLGAHPDAPKQDRTLIGRFPTATELKAYDVVILGDVDPKRMPNGDAAIAALAAYVKEDGGGLMMLAGEQASPHAYRDTPLADIMPVVCDGPPPPPAAEAIRTGYRPKLTPAGAAHPLFRFATDEGENADIWNRLSPLFWYATGYRRKLSAEVLAVHPDRAADPQPGGATREENHPLVLQQFVGAGRVMFIGFDETWRWRLREDEPRFNQFWVQAVRALARGRVGRIEVRTDRKSYRRDDPLRVTVRYPDDAPPPAQPVRVTVDRRAPGTPGAELAGSETETLQLVPRAGTRATYEALLTRTPEGSYTFSLTDPPPTGPRPTAEAMVLPPPGELDRIQLNEQDLRRAAKESRGAYYSLDTAATLPDDLPGGTHVALDQPVPPLSLWDHPLAFALVLWLLTAEWIMRKKWRLL